MLQHNIHNRSGATAILCSTAVEFHAFVSHLSDLRNNKPKNKVLHFHPAGSALAALVYDRSHGTHLFTAISFTMGIPYSREINAAFEQVTPLVAAGFQVLRTTKNISIILAIIQVLTVLLLGLILFALIALLYTVNPDLEVGISSVSLKDPTNHIFRKKDAPS